MPDLLWVRLSRKILKVLLERQGVACCGAVSATGLWPRVENLGHITLGSKVEFRGVGLPARLYTAPGALLNIGDRTFINSGVNIIAHNSVQIGPDCLIGDMVTISDTDFHPVDEGAEVRVQAIKLGRNVWLARGVIVLPGSEIGDHSVIGAGSLVTGRIPPSVLAGGAPARVLRQLRSSDRFRR